MGNLSSTDSKDLGYTKTNTINERAFYHIAQIS